MTNDSKKYQDFSVEDFVSDQFFQDWILRPNEESNAFWRDWLVNNSEREQYVQEAGTLLRNLEFKIESPVAGAAHQSRARALMIIDEIEQTAKRPGSIRSLFRGWRAAAIWIIVLGLAVAGYMLFNRETTKELATPFGKMDSVYLPDKSFVVLNANSSIRYKNNWNGNQPREVWLTGEALFNVKHLNSDNVIETGERFLVHVGQATIEVLGTSFDIRQRRGKIEVALIEGSIRLLFRKGSRPDLIMKPGELVVFDTAITQLQKSNANTEKFSAWRSKKLQLNNPTLREIATYLEDIYGKKIVLTNDAIAAEKVEGVIMLDSLDDALFIISTVLDVSIKEENNRLIISPR